MQFATGAMSSLLPKLGKLLLEEYNLQKGLKKGIKDLRDELLIIEAALVKVSDVPLDKLDPLVKIWANDVRELSYAIEDSLDSFMVRLEGLEPDKPHTFLGFIKKTSEKVTKLKLRREIANDIKDVKIQVKEVKERYDRYKDVICDTTARTEVDPRLLAMYNKVSDLIGIDKPIDELMEILSEGVDMSDGNLKIVSIVGIGGLGKTTIAKALYDRLKTMYQFHGFVPVGQNPDAKKVLRDIILELDRDLYRDAGKMDERQLINELQKLLAGKRYFIVIDDIWNIPTWETIKCAFMGSHPESRIIITTRVVDVATKAGGIYRMKPLSDDNSKLLFDTRTCGGEGVSPDNQPDEAIGKILKKCGGVPLAIISIASLLVGKPGSDWSKVYDAIGFGHEDSEVIQNTRKILSFSYYDLPPNLKTCLLYLSMFPEDYLIKQKPLIWRWVAEGFVPDKEGMGSYELGEIYFNKLVNRSMIQWIEPDELDLDDKGGCRVHDMVLDLIRTMSSDMNFVTLHDMEQDDTNSRGKQTSKVRRLALHGKSGEQNTGIHMGHVRSFNAIMCGDGKLHLLSRFRVLRVLVIEEECDFFKGHSLEHLGKLVQLRYLGLVKTSVKLPEGIGHDLKFLEILDVRGRLISELPPSVGELKNLRCLWADEGTIMKGNIGKLICLEELRLYSVKECPDFFTELANLTNLRVLQIELDACEETAGKALAESLRHLHKVQSLRVSWMDDTPDDLAPLYGGSLEVLAPSSRLDMFILNVLTIPRMPLWIDSLCVPLLTKLCLHVEVVEARDLQALGRLPSLSMLFLESEEEKRISYTFGSDEFQKLKGLIMNIEITLGEGALPMLEFLGYSPSIGRKDSLVPWRNRCPLLDEVSCRLDCANSGRREVKVAKAVLRKAWEARPNVTDIFLRIYIHNYSGKAGRLVDALRSILHGLDAPDAEETTADQRELRRMIRSLETLLRDADEPQVGRYGGQELCGFIAKFKSLLHDDAGTDQEEELENSNCHGTYTDTDDDSDDDSNVGGDGDNDDDIGNDDATEQNEANNDVATSSGHHEERTRGEPRLNRGIYRSSSMPSSWMMNLEAF